MSRLIAVCVLVVLPVVSGWAQTGERNILLEEFSTAQCGFCPDGDIIAEQIVEDHPTVIWVTHHSGFGTDAMTAEGSADIARDFTNFAPGACIDRGAFPPHVSPTEGKIATIRSKWDSLVIAHLGDEQYAELDLYSTFYGEVGQLNCRIGVMFRTAPGPGDIRINLYVVVDEIVGEGKGFDQRNYYNNTKGHPMYGLGDTVVGYVHKRVVRMIPTGPWGVEGIIPATPEIDHRYEHNLSTYLSWGDLLGADLEELTLVAFVSYYNEDPKQRQVIHSMQQRIDVIALGVDGPEAIPVSPAVEVYPNPVQGAAHFLFPGGALRNAVLTVTDITGRTLARYTPAPGTDRLRIPAVHLRPGMYFYRYSGGRTVSSGKFMVIH